jgi:hypothetical protein
VGIQPYSVKKKIVEKPPRNYPDFVEEAKA